MDLGILYLLVPNCVYCLLIQCLKTVISFCLEPIIVMAAISEKQIIFDSELIKLASVSNCAQELYSVVIVYV